MKAIGDIGDPRLVKALAHPLRVRLLEILEARTASPSELAEELGVPVGNVAYHVRTLVDFGLVKLMRRTPRRGAVEHHYRAVGQLRISDAVWSQVPDVVKKAMVAATLEQIADSVNDAAAQGGFDRTDAHARRTPMVLDRAGFKDVSRELRRLHDRAREIESECDERLAKSDRAGQLSAGLVLLLFEQPATGVAAQPPGTRARASTRQKRGRDAPSAPATGR
jgi:DNA-binding transcriptional ArsR family regulator